MPSATERAEIIRYLLDECSEEERQRVETAYFADPESYRRLLEVEDELAYRSASGELSATQREQFVNRLRASAAGREKAAFAEALTEVVDRLRMETPIGPARQPRGGFWKPGVWLPVAAAVALALFGWQWVQMRQLRMRLDARDAQMEMGRTNGSAPLALSFVLSPGLTRGPEQLQILRLPSGAAAVRLQLLTKEGDQGRSFDAVLSTAGGRQVWGQSGLRSSSADSRVVELTLPASVLAADEYDLALRIPAGGGEVRPFGTYHFAVTH